MGCYLSNDPSKDCLMLAPPLNVATPPLIMIKEGYTQCEARDTIITVTLC